jgi:hypothetical protein
LKKWAQNDLEKQDDHLNDSMGTLRRFLQDIYIYITEYSFVHLRVIE